MTVSQGRVGIRNTSPTNPLSVTGIVDVSSVIYTPQIQARDAAGGLTVLANNGSSSAGSILLRAGKAEQTRSGAVEISGGTGEASVLGGTVYLHGGHAGSVGTGSELYLEGTGPASKVGSITMLGGAPPNGSGVEAGSITIRGGGGGGPGHGGSVLIAAGDGEGGIYRSGDLLLQAGTGRSGTGGYAASGRVTIGIGATEYMRMDLNGNVGIATRVPSLPLDVNGAAQFGQGASRSTFTAAPGGSTFALQLSSGITISNGGSINLTSGGFLRFADGTTQVTAPSGGGGDAVLTATQTFSGINTFSAITLASASTVTTSGQLHRSTYTFMFANYVTGTNTSMQNCNISGSTITIRLDAAGDVVATYSGSVSGTNVQYIGAQLDGAYPRNSNNGVSAQNSGRGSGINDVAMVQFMWTNVAAGEHTICMIMGTNAGTWNLQEGNLWHAEVLK